MADIVVDSMGGVGGGQRKSKVGGGLTIILAFLVLVLAFTSWHYSKKECPSVQVNGSSSFNATGSELQVLYLYPRRCLGCDKKPNSDQPSCVNCDKYYKDNVVFDALSNDFGVAITPYVSEDVGEPAVLVASASNGKVGLGDASSKYNIATALCAIAGQEKACGIVDQRISGLRECLAKYGVSKDTLLYHYTSKGCVHCENMGKLVMELENLSFDLGGESKPYRVVWIDDENKTQMKVLEECVQDYMSLNYVPQVFCSANGRSKTGEMDSLSKFRDFADECMSSAERK